MADKTSKTEQVFIAYAYSLYPKDDYRKVFVEIESIYDVQFIFADEKITNMHIMNKIESYIRGAKFSIFDISGWNPNVTLELGFAMAITKDWYISYNPKHTQLSDVPSDIRGIDRIQYESLGEYSGKILALMEQNFPRQNRRPPIADYISSMQEDVITLLATSPGLKMVEISSFLSVDVRLAQVVISSLINSGKIVSTGATKGTKYSLKK